MLIDTIDTDILRLRGKNEKSPAKARIDSDRDRAKRDCKNGAAGKQRSPVLDALIGILSPMGQRGL